MADQVSESEPLLPQAQRLHRHRWQPHPRWLVPLALAASLARGITLAARVQIVTRLSCDALHRASRATLSTQSFASTTAIPDICFSDPAVQASAAQVQMLLTIISGSVTALTAGRWGKYGDTSGRTKVMSAALFGLIMAETVYGLTSMRNSVWNRHGHKILVLAPIFEGLFGSWPTLQANMNAYISDITPQSSAAQMFSRFMGILYIGFAVGPTIASFVLRQSITKNLTPLFFLSAGAYSLSFLFILWIVPESLNSSNKPPVQPSAAEAGPTPVDVPASDAMSTNLQRFIAPLAAFRPRRAGATRKDYTLTIIAASYFIYLTSLAFYQLKYLYAEHVFLWDAEQLGYYISYMGFARAITLLVLLPMWVYLFKPRRSAGRAAVSARRELNFDLSLVRMSVLLDTLSHALVLTGPTTSQSWFVLATTLTSLGSASVPSYSSTVLGYVRYRTAQAEQHDQEEDVGVLFGGLAVLQSLGQTIFGPILFALVYSLTVSTMPKGVFVLAAALAGSAFVLVLIARPRKRVLLLDARPEAGVNVGRGRSGITKPIRGSQTCVALLSSNVLPMKFGKRILSERIPGWLEYYLDYKALKKIISSVTPSHHTSYEALNEQTTQTTSMSPADVFRGVATPVQPLWESSPSLGGSPSTLSAKWAASSSLDYDRGPGFQMKKATFFFKLQRELDKINAFYLQKEAELKLRMITLLSKRQAAASRISLDTEEPDSIKDHAEWKAVVEGFTLLQNDLLKLQQFVDINATGFRKILKKWDKRSKSTTKELYLTRQVEVQPVFNRQLITEFSDTVAACLLNLTDTTIPISPALQEELSIHDSVLNAQLMREPLTRSRVFADLEENMRKAVADNDASAVQHTLATAKELLDAPDGKTFVARTIWRAAIDAEPAIADLILDSPDTPCDFRFVDDINGRTCMHEAAAAGALRLIDMCIAKGVEVNRRDSYGRTSLHYAVIGGHIACVSRLLAANADPLVLDMDNFSCLYYGVSYGHLECVRVLLQTGGVGVETTTEDDEANPLSLACRYGHSDIALLFLERGARQLPNTNGQLPIHLAAGAGHIEVCQLLANRAKETLDVKDKLNEWTPLFHAAREGRAPIVKILLSAGCNPDTVDELGRIPIFYAGWYGHVDCVQLLLHTQQSPGRAQSSTKKLPDTAPKSKPLVQTEDVDMDPDLIPSLSLPPPIMPFRIYGHNYLDKQYMVRITLGRPYSKFNEKREAPVIINAWSSDYPPSTPKAQPQSLLKMVMTSRSDASAVPVSLTVPLSEERDVVTFQVQDLAELSLEFSFYPRYGSRTIGRAAVLSSVFESIKSSRIIALAILDHRLHIIGRVIFEACVIRPFDAATLQVGGAVETYWKSLCHFAEKDNELITSPQSALDSTHTSPSNRSVLMNPSGSMAISSLSREFLTVVVQCTRDMVPVIHPEWDLPIEGLDIGVADVTCPQFERIALREKGQHNSTPPLPTATIQQWADWAGNAMITLDTILATVPVDIGINLQVAYPNRAIREAYGLGHYLDLNVYIESILLVIYKAASTYARRRISFVSFSPSICTALNWKQPNYPVFFASHCGMPEVERAKWRPPRPEPETDRRCISVAAAIEFAQANNLLGVFLNAQLLMQVPALMPGIKDVGLLLGVLGAYGDGDRPQIGPVHLLSQPDATWADGVIRFVDNTALAVQ